jgi:carboxyl-terminal processing protease
MAALDPTVNRWRRRAALTLLPLALAACGGGGGGDDGTATPLSCSVAARQEWLRDYMDSWYYWYALSPKPSPAGFASVESYFDALVYGGGDPIPGAAGQTWPADRYSNFDTTESFNRFYGDGRTLGYGVAVNGLEAVASGATRLFVRYVEPASPAVVTGGLVRGDEILAINGTSVAGLIAQDDFDALTPARAGDVLQLTVRRSTGATESIVLTARVYDLTPVQSGQVVATPNGRRVGYVFVKDMITQANSPLAATMADFKSQGVQDLVLDLRYNGGGLVSVGANLASHVGGATGSGQLYSRLLYNDRHQNQNTDTRFTDPNAWAGFGRVYVLMGERTCSASEQVINGLRGIGVNVVAIGGATCGKPVGFLPEDDSCGTTYSVVNFESVNARNEGRYFDGLAATCTVAEDVTVPLGATDDPLLIAAAHHADNGACPAGSAAREQPLARERSAARKRYRGTDGGERTGMLAR